MAFQRSSMLFIFLPFLSLLLPSFPATAPITFPHLQYLYSALVLSRTCCPLIVPFYFPGFYAYFGLYTFI